MIISHLEKKLGGRLLRIMLPHSLTFSRRGLISAPLIPSQKTTSSIWTKFQATLRRCMYLLVLEALSRAHKRSHRCKHMRQIFRLFTMAKTLTTSKSSSVGRQPRLQCKTSAAIRSRIRKVAMLRLSTRQSKKTDALLRRCSCSSLVDHWLARRTPRR